MTVYHNCFVSPAASDISAATCGAALVGWRVPHHAFVVNFSVFHDDFESCRDQPEQRKEHSQTCKDWTSSCQPSQYTKKKNIHTVHWMHGLTAKLWMTSRAPPQVCGAPASVPRAFQFMLHVTAGIITKTGSEDACLRLKDHGKLMAAHLEVVSFKRRLQETIQLEENTSYSSQDHW